MAPCRLAERRLKPMNLKQACVMVVDDQAVMRILITGNLRGLGVQQVHAFADGEAVLAALAATRPDVILTDVQMQPMDGMSLVRAIRALPDPALAATRIVFLSGDDSESTPSSGRGPGCQWFRGQAADAHHAVGHAGTRAGLLSLRRPRTGLRRPCRRPHTSSPPHT